MSFSRALSLSLCLAVTSACGSEPITVGRPPAPPSDPEPTPTGDAPPEGEGAGEGESAVAAADAGVTPTRYRDEDFAEADTNRDPFRPFATMFVPRRGEDRAPQREVMMPTTSVEEMRLIAVVTGVADPRAMLLDGGGIGHTVRRGDYVGRSETVQIGGVEGTTAALNWRVEGIRCVRPQRRATPTEADESVCEVVLTRDDPSAPNRPPLTRAIRLREEGAAELAPSP